MPKPVLQAMVLADHVYQDSTTGKFIIAGTFTRLWCSRKPLLGQPTPPPAAPPAAGGAGGGPAGGAGPGGGGAGAAAPTPAPGATSPEAPKQTTFQSASELVRAVSSAGSPYLYFALTGMHGNIPLKVCFVDLANSNNLFEIAFGVTSADPVAVSEYVIPMPRLPITGPGTFSLDLLYDDELIGSWRLFVAEQ
jgi:hypothetical protein